MLRKSKRKKPAPKGTRIGHIGPDFSRKPGEKDELFAGITQEQTIKLKYQYQRSSGTLFPYGGQGTDYWAGLEAFNARREAERRREMKSA